MMRDPLRILARFGSIVAMWVLPSRLFPDIPQWHAYALEFIGIGSFALYMWASE